MIEKKIIVFVDFDGTITTQDVGEAIFQKFGDLEKVNKIIEDLLADKISSRQCWDALFNSVDKIDEPKLREFISELKIEPSFHSFVDFCNSNDVELIVLSDGFDYYIDQIFKEERLKHLKYFSNKLKLQNGKFFADYPYYNPEFPASANCKRDHILNNSGEDDITVYIGDGNSDKEAAQYCDLIFAKNGLLKYCEKNRISYSPFNDFDDIKMKLKEVLQKKRIKKRHQAEIKRKNAYQAE